MLINKYFLLLLLIGYCHTALAQQADSDQVLSSLQGKMIDKFSTKTNSVNQKLQRQSARYLDKLQRKERKLMNQLQKKDSSGVAALKGKTPHLYKQWAAKLKTDSTPGNEDLSGAYMPYLDSVTTALKFLDKNPGWLNPSDIVQDKLSASREQLQHLQSDMNQAEDIQSLIRQKKEQIMELMKKQGSLPRGAFKKYQSFSKQAYYYEAQLNEYKNWMNEPGKIEREALRELNKLPAFKTFMDQNSMLADLFTLPENYGTPAALSGLQTRNQVQQTLASRMGSEGNGNAYQMIEQKMQPLESHLNDFKARINDKLAGNEDPDMPDFKPNHQKTKSFKDRLELGGNLQTVKSNRFFPGTTDLGASAGYKLNDKSVIGIGASYKVGWGRDIRNIRFSSEGMGLRSFIDYQLKGSFWLSGGAELNYRSSFSSFEILKSYSAWQQSALIGISRKYKVSKKLKGNAQLLYDALWKQQVPRTQAVVFRVGYNIN